MILDLEYPYSEKFIKGYLINKNNGRNIVLLIDKDNVKSTTSYSRYLMSVHLKRFLLKEEHIDHIDNNCNNDVISNLQILTQKENNDKRLIQYKIGRKHIEFICPTCNTKKIKPFNNCHLQPSMKRYMSFCSRECGYIFKRNNPNISLEDKINIGKTQITRKYILYKDNTTEDFK